MAIVRNLYHDFDAQFSEMHHDYVPFRIYGKEYKIPKQMPACLVLEMARMEGTQELSAQFLCKAANMIFGEDTLNEIMRHPDFNTDMLNAMIQWAFEAINGKVDRSELELTEDDSATADSSKN